MVKNFCVSETAVLGGLWHAPSGLGTDAPRIPASVAARMRNASTGNVGMRNAAPSLVVPLAATTATPFIAATAPAKQAPRPRGSLART